MTPTDHTLVGAKVLPPQHTSPRTTPVSRGREGVQPGMASADTLQGAGLGTARELEVWLPTWPGSRSGTPASSAPSGRV